MFFVTTIALTKSLAHLKYELENLGYNVLFEDEINSPVDVFIYLYDDQRSLYSTTQKLDSAVSSSYPDHEYHGTLLIDGMGKTIDEIKYIIENRVYSPIF